MEIAEFVGHMRTQLRAFEKYMRDAAKEDGNPNLLFNDFPDFLEQFEVFLDV